MDVFSKLSYISRTRKLKLFDKVMRPSKDMKVLDVGGQANPYGKEEIQFIDNYRWKKNVSVVNLSGEHISVVKKFYPEIEAVVGDCCELPWPDKSFDIVYSNAVIEHLGNFTRQKKMATEVMRVGKRWFVTTPNRWFPFEFHTRLPFVTWFPGNVYLWISDLISYSHIKKKYTMGKKIRGLRLMSVRELKECFQNSKIVKHRVTFMAETLIVISADSQTL